METIKKKLYIFDMDGTIIRTEPPESGKLIWLKKTGTEWPFKGWWGRNETLRLDIFANNLIEGTHKIYMTAISDPEILTVLMTGRHLGMREAVNKLLDKHDLVFDMIKLNDGGETIVCKKRQILEILTNFPDIGEIEIFEDREEHIIEFKEFFEKLGINANINHIT